MFCQVWREMTHCITTSRTSDNQRMCNASPSYNGNDDSGITQETKDSKSQCTAAGSNHNSAGTSAYNELKHVVAIYVRQSSDEVTCYHLTGAIGDLIGLKRTMWFGM